MHALWKFNGSRSHSVGRSAKKTNRPLPKSTRRLTKKKKPASEPSRNVKSPPKTDTVIKPEAEHAKKKKKNQSHIEQKVNAQKLSSAKGSLKHNTSQKIKQKEEKASQNEEKANQGKGEHKVVAKKPSQAQPRTLARRRTKKDKKQKSSDKTLFWCYVLSEKYGAVSRELREASTLIHRVSVKLHRAAKYGAIQYSAQNYLVAKIYVERLVIWNANYLLFSMI